MMELTLRNCLAARKLSRRWTSLLWSQTNEVFPLMLSGRPKVCLQHEQTTLHSHRLYLPMILEKEFTLRRKPYNAVIIEEIVQEWLNIVQCLWASQIQQQYSNLFCLLIDSLMLKASSISTCPFPNRGLALFGLRGEDAYFPGSRLLSSSARQMPARDVRKIHALRSDLGHNFWLSFSGRTLTSKAANTVSGKLVVVASDCSS